MRVGREAGPRWRRDSRGFTYLGVLFLVVLMGLALVGAGQLWSTGSQRAREKELLWIGTQYAKALQSYYNRSPGAKQYPLRLDDLVEDNRFPNPVRHLRRLYRDPIAPDSDWGVVKTADGRIAGIYSQSEARPLKRANFPLLWANFEGKEKYAEWRFVADAALRAAQTPEEAAGKAAATGNVVGRVTPKPPSLAPEAEQPPRTITTAPPAPAPVAIPAPVPLSAPISVPAAVTVPEGEPATSTEPEAVSATDAPDAATEAPQQESVTTTEER